jgi:hypothetical protein
MWGRPSCGLLTDVDGPDSIYSFLPCIYLFRPDDTLLFANLIVSRIKYYGRQYSHFGISALSYITEYPTAGMSAMVKRPGRALRILAAAFRVMAQVATSPLIPPGMVDLMSGSPLISMVSSG